jgi:hypothetical protein
VDGQKVRGHGGLSDLNGRQPISPIVIARLARGSRAGRCKYGLEPTTLRQTDHYRAMREFFADPKGFVEAAIVEVDLDEREGGA